MAKRARSAIRLRLWPSSDGEATRFRVEGTLPTRLPASALHQLLSPLVYWSGRPLHVVLAAGGQAGWCEVVVDAMAAIPERHVTIEFDLAAEPDDAAAW